MYAKQNWAFVRIVLEVPLAVIYGPIAASGPEKDPTIKALNEVLETEAPRQSYIPLVERALVPKHNHSTVNHERNWPTARNAYQIATAGALHQGSRRQETAHLPQRTYIIEVCEMVQIRLRTSIVWY